MLVHSVLAAGPTNLLLGGTLALIGSSLSPAAGVIVESILRDGCRSFWVCNLELGITSAFIGMLALAARHVLFYSSFGLQAVLTHGPMVLGLVASCSIVGLLAGSMIWRFDVVQKEIIQCLAISSRLVIQTSSNDCT